VLAASGEVVLARAGSGTRTWPLSRVVALAQADNGNSMIARMNDDALLPTHCRSTP
jgi:hypothetical protein